MPVLTTPLCTLFERASHSNENRLEEAQKALSAALKLTPHDTILMDFDQRLGRGEKLPLKSRALQQVKSHHQAGAEIAEASDSELGEVVRLGALRRLRFQLEFAPEGKRELAVEELKQVLREDPTFAYGELLAARHRLWDSNNDILRPFAVAFEEALGTEDRGKLERLAMRQPRLEALILVAQALIGDADAQRKVEAWLRDPQPTEKEPAIAGLHSALHPVLRVIEGGRSLREAFIDESDLVVSALHDANEAALGEIILAA
jgi:tetratricopeptide (TPR) repeat protein